MCSVQCVSILAVLPVVVSRRLEPRGALVRHDVLCRLTTSATGSHVLRDLHLVGVRTLLPRDGVLTSLDDDDGGQEDDDEEGGDDAENDDRQLVLLVD